MSDIPSLPEVPATLSATGSAKAAANGHTLGGDLAATQESVSGGMTAAGDGYSAGAGAHASADGVSASASANGHGASVDATGDVAANASVLDTLQDKLGELGANMHGALDVVLELRAVLEGALPF